ncbi:MAG: DUF3999 family protein [Candidatus Vogelbacteria bacterium]|nr:DUF3999 family protein [Candidatus Vogelbacteria bacterium]
MKKTGVKKLLLAISLLLATTASADFNKTNWEFRSEIIPERGQPSGYISFDIPKETFQNLNQNLSDLRIISGDAEVPFVLTAETEKESLSNVPSKIFNISSVQGQSTSFIADVGNTVRTEAFHSQITIETSSENFKRDVKIEGSNDQKNWSILNLKGQIFDYTYRENGYVNSRFMSIEYPQATWRYLRVTIFDRGETALKIVGASVENRLKSVAREISYSPTISRDENSNGKSTDLILDVGQSGAPHSRGDITTEAGNFSRAIVISESADRVFWKVLGNGYIFSIATPEFTGGNLKFYYPESRKRYLKISILNRDDQSIEISDVKLYGAVRKVLFSLRPDQKYYMYFGNTKAKAGEYDLSTVSQYLSAVNIGNASINKPEKNLEFTPTLPPLSERSPYILPSFLILVVIILGVILVKLLKK